MLNQIHNNPKQQWNNIYAQAPQTFSKMKKVKRVACAFNSCIDSIVKLTGDDLQKMIQSTNLTLADLQNIKYHHLEKAEDIIKGIFRCFSLGIAEEWVAQSPAVFEWMMQNLGTQKIQIGGQAGIIANTVSLAPIDEVIVHSNALSKLQAEQFFNRPNLQSFDRNGVKKPAYSINRNETSSIHWIIEFDRDDKIIIDGVEFVCPKSNRFIATYDPPLFDFVVDKNFLDYSNSTPVDFFILSGYQALDAQKNGLKHIQNSVKIINDWKKSNPQSIIHLEIASTQDKIIRKAVVEQLAPLVDSVGVNERETMDILEILNQKKLLDDCLTNPNAINLFKAVFKIKEILNCQRIQLHFFGLYITIQNQNYPLSPLLNRNGMVLAATAAAGKALIGQLSTPEDITKACNQSVSDIGLEELTKLADFLKIPQLISDGIGQYKGYDIIAVPTIIIKKPKTLVGMGDTISSFSLIGAV